MSLKRSKRLLGANQFFDGRTPGAGPEELKSILERMQGESVEEQPQGKEPDDLGRVKTPTDPSGGKSDLNPDIDIIKKGTAGQEASEAASITIPLRKIVNSLMVPASKLAGIRYSLSELDLLEETLYQVWKESGQKLQKQEVARLALRVLLEEYGAVGKESILWRYTQARHRPNRTK